MRRRRSLKPLPVPSAQDADKVLTNLREFPPHGYIYREPSLNWEMPREVAMIGLREAAQALQQVRLQNPASGLDPNYAACVEAIKTYTCVRLKYDPRWCGLPPAEEQKLNALKYPQSKRGCAGCRR